MKTYRKWGMAFGIISFIIGIISLLNALGFFIMGLLTSSIESGTAGMIMYYYMTYVVIFAVLGVISGIIGIVGWNKKSLSITGLVLSFLVLVPTLVFLLLNLIYG